MMTSPVRSRLNGSVPKKPTRHRVILDIDPPMFRDAVARCIQSERDDVDIVSGPPADITVSMDAGSARVELVVPKPSGSEGAGALRWSAEGRIVRLRDVGDLISAIGNLFGDSTTVVEG